MREQAERKCEVFEEFGGFKQHDIVDGTYEGGPFKGGEVKSFTRWLDTGEVVANITNTSNSVGLRGDVHVNPGSLKLKFRLGEVENSRFKAGMIS